jgi:4-amino-4-deoxy-L-arabinose transferase-like glycosyltransferase
MHTRPIHALLVAFALVSLVYSLTTPLVEAPDEPAHVDYMLYLARGNGLPVQSFEHDKVKVIQGHHPPLYYALGAALTFWIDTNKPAYWLRENPNFHFKLHGTGQEPNYAIHTVAEAFPWHGYVLAAHLFRLLSIAFGVITVWGAYRLAWLMTRREVVALGSAALVAFNPMFLFISGVANNDNAVTAFLTLALVGLVTMLVNVATTRRALWLGICLGLAMLSKATALAWAPLVAYTLAVLWWRQRSWRSVGTVAAAIALPFLALSGWWFVRNQALYGDPLGYRMFLSNTSVIFPRLSFTSFSMWWDAAQSTHRTFWGHFGWLARELRVGWLLLFASFYILAPAGAVAGWLWRREAHAWPGIRHWSAWGLLVLAIAVNLAWVMNFARSNGASAFQGRYLYPAIAAISLFLVHGISSAVPERWRPGAVALLLTPVVVMALRVPGAYIAPLYHYDSARPVADPTAPSAAPSFSVISATSRSTSDPATMPAPAKAVAVSPARSRHRMATVRSPLPAASTQPTRPPYQPRVSPSMRRITASAASRGVPARAGVGWRRAARSRTSPWPASVASMGVSRCWMVASCRSRGTAGTVMDVTTGASASRIASTTS